MRYVILVLCNTPIILLALANLITRYKLRRIDIAKFRRQLLLWVILLIVLISSFPVYNLLSGKALLDSRELSAFDIVQTTAIIILFYIVNNQRQKHEQTERYLRDFHQELSIRLSEAPRDQTKN